MTTNSQVDHPALRSNRDNAHSPACPMCGKVLNRMRRRAIDRMVSVFVPFKRFRCRDVSCQWEGNLRTTLQKPSAVPDVSESGSAQRTRASGGRASGGLPKSFVINMCLVFVGLLAVIAVTTTDMWSDSEAARAERRIERARASSEEVELGAKIGRPAQPASSP